MFARRRVRVALAWHHNLLVLLLLLNRPGPPTRTGRPGGRVGADAPIQLNRGLPVARGCGRPDLNRGLPVARPPLA